MEEEKILNEVGICRLLLLLFCFFSTYPWYNEFYNLGEYIPPYFLLKDLYGVHRCSKIKTARNTD